MRRAIALAVAAVRGGVRVARAGNRRGRRFAAFGGDNVVQFGPSSALPHGASGPRPLAKGEAVLIDAWDRPEGYFYDITRSTFFGKPDGRVQEDLVGRARGADGGIEKAAPGVPCSEVDAAARARHRARRATAKYFTHRLGHGLGIDVHEPPYMVGHNRTILEPGMTFTSEPGIYLPGRFGVRIEDDILVTERGAEISLAAGLAGWSPYAA